MPPPEPRSSTVSPGSSSASAVGLPQPSDAAPPRRQRASFGRAVQIRGDRIAAAAAAARSGLRTRGRRAVFLPNRVLQRSLWSYGASVPPALPPHMRQYECRHGHGGGVYLSIRIWIVHLAGTGTKCLQGPGGPDARAHPRTAGSRRNLCVPPAREFEAVATARLAPPGLSAARGPGRDTEGRAMGALSARPGAGPRHADAARCRVPLRRTSCLGRGLDGKTAEKKTDCCATTQPAPAFCCCARPPAATERHNVPAN